MNPNYSWLLIERMFCVRWKKLSIDALDKIVTDVANAHRAVNQPLIYLTLIPEHIPVPSAAERAALNDLAGRTKDHLEVVHMIIEGDSIKHTLQRAAVTSVLFLMQRGKTPMQIHKTLADALKQVGPVLKRDPADLMKVLTARGFTQPD